MLTILPFRYEKSQPLKGWLYSSVRNFEKGLVRFFTHVMFSLFLYDVVTALYKTQKGRERSPTAFTDGKKEQAASVHDLSPTACHFLVMLFQPLYSEARLQVPQKGHNAALGEKLIRQCNDTIPACFHGKLSASEARGLWIHFLSYKVASDCIKLSLSLLLLLCQS